MSIENRAILSGVNGSPFLFQNAETLRFELLVNKGREVPKLNSFDSLE
jgi:hypothetical protein